MADQNNVLFFSKKSENIVLQNIHYMPLAELLNSKYHDENSIIITQKIIHMIANTDENKRMPIGVNIFIFGIKHAKGKYIVLWDPHFLCNTTFIDNIF